MARPTMKDVAELAQVGLKTVSRVVNGEGYVSAETAARVERAIAETGFVPNEIARRMRPGRSSRDVGLLLGDLANPFFAAVASTVIDGAKTRRFAVMIASADEDPRSERPAIEGLLARQVAGLLIVPGSRDYTFLGAELELGTPVVFLDRPGPGLAADEVLIDNVGGARTATEHLIEHGYRRIAIIVAPSHFATGERLRGYREAMRRRFGSVPPELVCRLEIGSPEAAQQAATALLASAEPPDAFFTTTGYLTQGLLRALGGRTDVGVIGFDDFPLADMLQRPVTVVSGEPAELGSRAIQQLFARVDGDQGPPARLVVTPRLIARGSAEGGRSSARRRPSAPGRTD